MVKTLWEGDCVRHAGGGFVGVHVGFTRLARLMERTGDLRGVHGEFNFRMGLFASRPSTVLRKSNPKNTSATRLPLGST